MEDKLQQAKELLWANGYRTIKMTDGMNEDADECEKMMDQGENKDCSYCRCSGCVMEF